MSYLVHGQFVDRECSAEWPIPSDTGKLSDKTILQLIIKCRRVAPSTFAALEQGTQVEIQIKVNTKKRASSKFSIFDVRGPALPS